MQGGASVGFINVLKTTPLKSIMTCPTLFVDVNSEFSEVEKIMRESGIKHVPVVDENNRIYGIITLSDLYRTCAPRRNLEDGSFYYQTDELNRYILKYVMTKDPFVLRPEESMYVAMNKMVENKVGCIPIVNNQRQVVGIITQTDIVKNFTKLLHQHG